MSALDLSIYSAPENKLQASINRQLRDQIIAWCSDLHADRHLDAGMVDDVTRRLAERGPWERYVLGYSRRGNPIWCLEHEPEDPDRVIVAYGYPHPDEPAGATGLWRLCERISDGDLPPGLERACWHVVLCADPDQAAMNVDWVRSPTLASYVRGNWRPAYLGLEVDYAFPIDYGPLMQPRGYAPEGMKRPLPESLALADLFERTRPDVVGMMHGNHASGAYNYLSHRPHPSLIEAFDRLGAQIGVAAHYGERPDPGKRWRRTRPDFLKERKLADRIKWLHGVVGDFEGRRYLGCVSAGMYLEALKPDCLVLTPEVGLFRVPDIDSTAPAAETRRVTRRVERTRRGPRWITRGELQLPDGSTKRVCYHIRPAGEAGEEGEAVVPLSRGMAGVEAVELRRFWLGRIDRLWARHRDQLNRDSDRLAERRKITVPAAQVNDRAMLIFRTSDRYLRAVTEAELSDFQSRWRLEDCRWLGHAMQLYAEQDVPEAEAVARGLLEQAERELGHLSPMPLELQVRSQIGRLLLGAAAERVG